MMTQFAKVYWTASDIIRIRPDTTVELAEAWLSIHEETLKERMIERGWDAIETLLCQDEIDH